MAYRKRRYRKRRYKRKAKGANDKTVTVWSDHSVLEKANKALNLASKVYRFVNTEIKFADTVATPLTIPNGGGGASITSMHTIPQGDGQSTRDGDSLKPLHFTFRGRLIGNSNVSNTIPVRIIFFRGKQENGVVPTGADILATQDLVSPKDYDERFRSKILYDKVHQLTANYSGQIVSKMIYFQVKMDGHITYSAASTNVENGGLYMLALSNQGVGNEPTMNYRARLTYVDN